MHAQSCCCDDGGEGSNTEGISAECCTPFSLFSATHRPSIKATLEFELTVVPLFSADYSANELSLNGFYSQQRGCFVDSGPPAYLRQRSMLI